MPPESRKKRQAVRKSLPRASKLRAKRTNTTTEIDTPSQSSSVESKIDLRRSKRQRKNTEPFQVTFIKRSTKTQSNKKAAVNASSSEVTDEFHLKCIFPEEIWMIILEKCAEPTDLENLSNASLYFRDLLLPQRVNFLFPNVWKILGNKYHEDYGRLKGHDESFNPNKNRVQLISNRKNIFRQYPILKLRLVCKDWNKSIQDFYQYHPSHFDTQDQRKCVVGRTTKWPDLCRWSMDKFLPHFRNTHGQTDSFRNRSITKNPFLSRKVSLTVRLRDREQEPAKWQLMKIFLCSYGHHIWYLDLKIDNISMTGELYMSLLQYLFSYFTYLKGLRVDSDYGYWDPPLSPETLKTFCFPKFKYLQFLSICKMPYFAQDMLERKNSHVAKLEFQRYNYYYLSGVFHEFSCPHPKLRSLAVTVDRSDDFKRLNLFSMKWKLTEFALNCIDSSNDISWADVFALIANKWAKTLTNLNLKLPIAKETLNKTKIMEECSYFQLRLPQLKSLTVVLPEFTTLDFILPLNKTLEELNIHIQFRHRFSNLACEIERKQQIEFLGYTSRPLESNIWNIFKKLRVFRSYEQEEKDIPTRSYTRHDWELWKCGKDKEKISKNTKQQRKKRV